MKKIKILFLLIFLIFISGCDVEYNVTVRDDGIFEEVILMDDNESIRSRYLADNLNQLFAELELDFEEQHSEAYTFERIIGEERSGLIISRNIDSYEFVTENSIFIYNSCFQTRNFVRDRNRIILNMDNQTRCDIFEEDFNITVKVSSDIPLDEGNYDYMLDDSYFWELSSNPEENHIRLILDSNLLPPSALIQNTVVQSFLIFFLIIGVTFSLVGYLFYRRYKKVNELW